MADAETLIALQRQIERLEGSRPVDGGSALVLASGHPGVDACFPGGGLACGTHQFSSAADDPAAASAFACLLLAHAFRQRPSSRALVVQEISAVKETGALYGPGLHALGLDPGRLVFVATPNGTEALRVANDALALAAADILVLGLCRDAALGELSVTRRFNLAADRRGAWVLLATPGLDATSAALTRWRISSAPSAGSDRFLGAPAFDLDLTRNRHGRLGRWRVTWSSHDRRFQPAPRHSRPEHILPSPLAASVAA